MKHIKELWEVYKNRVTKMSDLEALMESFFWAVVSIPVILATFVFVVWLIAIR